MDDNNMGGGGRSYRGPPDNAPPPPPVKNRRRQPKQSPQETVQQFWDRLHTKYPGKVFTILPDNPYARKKAARVPHGTVHGQHVAKSYEEARAECIRDVNRIIKECRRLNQKYRDPHFDIEWDLKSGQRNCLDGLSVSGDRMKPKGVKRVTDIFEKPQFYVNGPTAGDVRQGRDGDCFLMAALCGLGNMKGLIDKVCVKHDQNVGVYGFVFHRDGEWQHTIIDDKLYLRAPDYDEAQDERVVWDDINRVDADEEYRKTHQTGSRALYFAQCSDENETWLPLLEKAYAKAHGDFASIDGGFTGEAIEDLTGGVTQEIYSTDILDKEAFWRDELMEVGRKFLFGCATGFYSNWLDTSSEPRERQGISEGHAYSLMEAREENGQRLLKLRNPWGKKEWTGKWSDGSAEWTPEWMKILNHKFGNDGIFWISYEDLLRKYQHFDRTRIFGPEWTVTQCWTSVSVSWNAEYHSTKFSLTLDQDGPVVIVLSQLDDTYFSGLEGPYGFDLHFRLESDDKEDEDDYIVRSNGNYAMARSVSTDIELEAGTYSVLMKITATRYSDKESVEDALPGYAATRREKLIQMGLSYDLAHAKGVFIETPEEKAKRKTWEKAQKAKDREKLKERLRAQAERHWRKEKERHLRNKARRERKERAEAKRRQGHASEITDSRIMTHSPQRMDSLDVHNSQTPELENNSRQNSKDEDTVIRIKSFSGEDIIIRRKSDGATPNGVSQHTGHSAEAPKPQNPVAASIVEPLEDVIKIADAESQPDKNYEDLGSSKATRTPAPLVTQTETAEPAEDLPPTPIVQINGVDAITDVRPLPNPVISKPEADKPSLAVQPAFESLSRVSPITMIDVPGEIPAPAPTPPVRSSTLPDMEHLPSHDGPLSDGILSLPALSPPLAPSEISDADSFPSFDWSSAVDMPTPSPSSSDSEDSVAVPYRRRSRTGRRRGSIPAPPSSAPDGSPDVEDNPGIPWNAVCVVGLRVYSAGKGVHLKVVKGTADDDADDERESKKKRGTNGNKGKGREVLDPDDQNRGAVAVETGKEDALQEKETRSEASAVDDDGKVVKEEKQSVDAAEEPGHVDNNNAEHPLSFSFIDKLVKGAIEKGEANAKAWEI